MANTLGVLGQLAPSATTLSDLYVVPGATHATVSSLTVCNRGGSATTFRIAIAVAGAANANAQYLYYDTALPANDTFSATLGLALGPADVIRVYAGNGNLSFNAFGVEVS